MKTLLVSRKVELGRSEQPNVTWAEPTKEELKRNADSIARALRSIPQFKTDVKIYIVSKRAQMELGHQGCLLLLFSSLKF
jgi:hypothetical protein